MTLTNLDDEIFAQSALEGFVNTLVPFAAFSRNFSPEPVQKGKDVVVPLIGSLTATTFGGSYAVTGGTMSVVTVSINAHKHVPVSVTDIESANSSKADLQAFARQMGASLGLLVFQDVMSLITTSNFSLATAVASTAFAIAQIRKARLDLAQNKVPRMNRAMILDCVPFDNLLGISNFIQVNLSGSSETLRDGQIGKALGFTIYETDGLPGTNSVMGFVGHGSAIAIAMRYLQPLRPERYIEARPVSDPETGLTMGLRRHYDPNTGIEFLNLEANYGYAKGISNGARVLHRTD